MSERTKTSYTMEYSERYMQLCRREGFFTCGCNKQYDICADLAGEIGWLLSFKGFKHPMTSQLLSNLIAMTYICSDTDHISQMQVAKALAKLFK